ncbi:MAG: AAA domain-containing protein, partial [Nitrospiraceae bacterium]|nr:AAA domain-containing protein [Nitrospiraceae bacterium]
QRDYAEYKLEQKENQLAEVKQELKDTKDELAIQERLEGETAKKVYMLGKEVDRLKSEETTLNSSVETLKVLEKQLKDRLDGQGGAGTSSEEKYRDLWHPVSFPDLSPVAGNPNEKQLLKKTADYIRGQKLYFPERVLYAFHTALKINDISPLVVLAGISGTGKSELPRRYAEGMGLHFVILPVQPRWDSPQDLFGFYNYLEGRYKATELARAMVQFELYNRELWPLPKDWNHDRSDRILLVLLDEMNLARVEYYFSEFLSRLETRRGINQKDKKERAKAEIALEMGSLRKGDKPIRLFPGQNILFVGTMNEDETTQALSDKVLDRACVMRFGRPKKITEKIDAPKKNPSKNGLTYKQWNSWLEEKISSSDKDRVNRWINKLNDAMDGIHRPFAYRVTQAIQSYVANYPDWVPNKIETAMADQIEQRIMPKLRGVEIADSGQSLKRIRSVIEQCNDQELLKAFKKGSENQEIFIWEGIDRTE